MKKISEEKAKVVTPNKKDYPDYGDYLKAKKEKAK